MKNESLAEGGFKFRMVLFLFLNPYNYVKTTDQQTNLKSSFAFY